MQNSHIFIIIIVIIFVLLYVFKMYENYETNSFDITPSITVDMDWKGSQLSTYPYYPNNLINSLPNIKTQIKKLQSYQEEMDGPTETKYVQNNMKVTNSIDNPNNLEGFTMMNPYIK